MKRDCSDSRAKHVSVRTCGSAAARCGKALPYRKVLFSRWRLRLVATRRHSLEYKISSAGKAEPYRTVGRQSRMLPQPGRILAPTAAATRLLTTSPWCVTHDGPTTSSVISMLNSPSLISRLRNAVTLRE